MSKSLEKQLEEHILNGRAKREIFKELLSEENRSNLLFHLNNNALLSERKKYLYVNLLLAAALTLLTVRLFVAIFSYQRFGLFLLPEMVVPTINIYLLREILRFHRVGYQLLAVLATLSLFHQHNRGFPELYIYITMICLSLFLFSKIFPKNKILP